MPQTKTDLRWSEFEYRDNPISDTADKIRYEVSYLSIEDGFAAVKRVYDEMRGAVVDGSSVHDEEHADAQA